MAPRTLRRSRAAESDDDEDEPSRQSTPASTAPNDGKRLRRSFTQDHDSSDLEVFDTPRRLQSQPEKKPSIVNDGTKERPKHQPGAIVRVKLTNFVTYTSAEFFPGPNLNMVIGPNGTGKSTLVCAICLGLGWATSYLGRAKDVAEFVKHGCREATIEIELQRSLRGSNASRVNPVITRTIKREGNKSTYTLNGANASGKAVMELARSFNIQIDNLCQFLPQDKVVEFAQMTPIEILQSTQSAAAPPFMLQCHENLKEMRKAQKESNDNQKNDKDALANLENRQEMQRTEVERLRERATVQKRLGNLEKCRPVPQYAEALAKAKQSKLRLREVGIEYEKLHLELEPMLGRVESKRVYAKRVHDHKAVCEKEVKNAEKECDRLARSIENHEVAMKDCDQMEAAEKRAIQPARAEIGRTNVRIATLKQAKEQPPEAFDSRAMNEEIQSLVTRIRTIETRMDEIRNEMPGLKQQAQARQNRVAQLKKDLETLETVTGRQEDLLKSKSNDAYRAWEWIKANRERFRKQVFGPPMVECTMRNPSQASIVESALQQNDFRIFTVQCREDFLLLQDELNRKQRLHDISLRTCPFDSLENFKAPLRPDEMAQYGLTNWVIECLEGPPTVLAMLCQEKFLHQCAMTDTDITQAQHDQLSVITGVKGYVSRNKSYQFIRRAEYGAAGVHAKEKYVRKAEVWTNQTVDAGRKQQLEADRREAKGELHELTSEWKTLAEEIKSLATERSEIEVEVKKLRDEKDAKQKDLTEYNGLDTKITQAQENVMRLQENIDTTSARLQENQEKRDAAMFAGADAVLEYSKAVHKLQEKTKQLIEIEVAYIEARNDFDVLSERNKQGQKILDDKLKEKEEMEKLRESSSERAKELMAVVKKLRAEGDKREEEEDDSGLIHVMEELNQAPNLRESDLNVLIEVEQAKLELTEGGDANTIKEYEERAKKIEQLRSRLTKTSGQQEDLLHSIREVRGKWEKPLDELVAKISDAFGDSFARIGCAGQVVVHKASSDDPADCSEDLGGRDNGLDFANWAIHISVKFRDNEALTLLDSHRQSGGERAVSTIFYLMALQSLSRAPFRVVDEINQGMDPRNERMVHGRMVDIAAADENGNRQGSQYFLITPKLLSGLKYKEGMTVLCIVSGENMPSAGASKVQDEKTGRWVTFPGRKMDFAAFVRKARGLGLGLGRGAGEGIVAGGQAGRSFDSLQTLGRSQASVGA